MIGERALRLGGEFSSELCARAVGELLVSLSDLHRGEGGLLRMDARLVSWDSSENGFLGVTFFLHSKWVLGGKKLLCFGEDGDLLSELKRKSAVKNPHQWIYV